MLNKKRNKYIMGCIFRCEYILEENISLRERNGMLQKVIGLSEKTQYDYKEIADLYYKLSSAGYNKNVKQLIEKLCETLNIKSVYLYSDEQAIDLLIRKDGEK